MSGLRVAVVGATGLVGREVLSLLEKRRFPAGEIAFFAGSGGRKLPFRGRRRPVHATTARALKGFDLALFAADDDIVRRFARPLAASGTTVIDESAAFRMEPGVPLVIPEINGAVLRPSHKFIAGPNCTTAALLMGVYPVHRRAPVLGIRAATYQAVSGAGKAAVEEFSSQVAAWARGDRRLKSKILPQPIAFNLFPHIGSFDSAGHSSEELKMARESRKILGASGLRFSATTVRVPVFRGHSIAAWLETARPVTPSKARAWLSGAPGVRLMKGELYPTPLMAAEQGPVFVGRLKQGSHARELSLWVVGDNLLKGAALNSVQIAELLLQKGFLRPRA